MIQVPEDYEQSKFGHLIKGFPFNTKQALLFDRYINGANLALHLKTANQSSDYTSSIEPLLSYYSERVPLHKLRAPCWSYKSTKPARQPSNSPLTPLKR